MVEIHKNNNIGNPSTTKRKQFTLLALGLGLVVLVSMAVYKTSTPKGDASLRSTSTTTKQTLGGGGLANGSDQRSTSIMTDYTKPDSSPEPETETETVATTRAVDTSTNSHGQPKIRQISLLGERNSGTRWSLEHLQECFNHSIPVQRHLTRYKHWFQYENSSAYPHDTLVIAQFRNPYDWLKAMQRVPHHSSMHIQKEWKEFLTIPWTAPRIGEDIEIGKTITDANNSTATTPCQQNFIYQDIVSCIQEPVPKEEYPQKLRFSEQEPFYEMRPNSGGQPFKSVMDMRSAKIQNYLDIANYEGVAGLWTVQYEYLLRRGTEHLIQRVSEWTGIEAKCDPQPPQLRRERSFEPGFVEYVKKHLNWTAEGLIGYGGYKTRDASKEESSSSDETEQG